MKTPKINSTNTVHVLQMICIIFKMKPCQFLLSYHSFLFKLVSMGKTSQTTRSFSFSGKIVLNWSLKWVHKLQ